ncbi:hypothetical protein PCANC_23550 [Puccinia coronata f. sp. avenae]|uniref:Uncharacterized protein n=1 Tax=Puccinia coronata f. sp. avenae TaxID=200324 RepID=A0A2N5RZK6_9BASI|nr:hypothetical protein PCANC_23550 [Puccinia coronata f. sp. avenae]
MNDNLRRSLNKDTLSRVPPGVNPFTFFISLITPTLSYSLSSNSARVLLWVCFALHWLVAIFCLVVLGLLYQRGAKQFLWLVRRLYIEDRNGKYAPLLFTNAGALIPLTQCMGSLSAQCFILLTLKNVQAKLKHSDHHLVMAMMAIMFACEVLSYWILTHCFLVAIYSSYPNCNQEGDKRWTPSPNLVNAVSLGFPIVLIIVCTTVFALFSAILDPFLSGVVDIMATLREGASIWDRLRFPSTSPEEKYHLGTNLTQVISRAERIGQRLETDLRLSMKASLFLQWAMLGLICIAALAFVLVFGKLGQRFHEQARQSSTSPLSQSSPIQLHRWSSERDSSRIISQKPIYRHRTLIDTIRSNRKFLYLIMRALFIFIAMLTTLSTLILGIACNDQYLSNPELRGALTWLSTASGTWSAFPISWHCWMLYKDETGGNLLTSSISEPKEVALKVYKSHDPPQQSSEPILEQITIERDFQNGNPLNFSQALKVSPSAQGSLADSSRNFSS